MVDTTEIQSILETLGKRVPPGSCLFLVGGSALALLERFIPLPKGSDERSIRIGQFVNLEVYVADPYSIALSKLDRGFDTDLDDIVFLIHHDHVTLEELERILQNALSHASKFDFNPEVLAHLRELKNRLK